MVGVNEGENAWCRNDLSIGRNLVRTSRTRQQDTISRRGEPQIIFVTFLRHQTPHLNLQQLWHGPGTSRKILH